MTIDSHQHFWKFDPVRDSWITDDMKDLRRDFFPQDLGPLLVKNDFDGTVAVQADQSVAETNFLLSLAENHSFIKGVVGWVDLRSESLIEELTVWSKFDKLKGFRHIVQSEPKGFLTDPKFIQGVKLLGQLGFTYDLLIYHYQLEEALAFIYHVPEVRVVIDHMAKPSIRTRDKKQWALGMAALSTFPNVFCKISGMVTEASWTNWKNEDFKPYLDELLDTFGASRLMYGSDWPVCLVAGKYEDQFDIVTQYISKLSQSEQNAILGDNAVKFYNL